MISGGDRAVKTTERGIALSPMDVAQSVSRSVIVLSLEKPSAKPKGEGDVEASPYCLRDNESSAMRSLLTIDFEASCLPRHGRSYPIEVGVADLGGWSRSWLIRPNETWREWTWTAEAEALHGISRAQLDRDGQEPTEVLHELDAVLQGHTVISDNDLDRGWLATLCDAAGRPARFEIGHIADLLNLYQPTAEHIRKAVAKADIHAPNRHQARADAIWLASIASSVVRGSPASNDRPLFSWDQSVDLSTMPHYVA